MSPEEKKLEKLNALFELVNQDFATPDDLIQLSEAILNIITTEKERVNSVLEEEKAEDKKEKAEILAILDEKERGLKQIITRLTYQTEQSVAKVDSKLTNSLSSEIKRLERKIPTKTDLTGLESDIKALRDGLNSLPTEFTINNEAIRDGLELLQGDERLNVSAIKGLDDWDDIKKKANERVHIGAGVGALKEMHGWANGSITTYNKMTVSATAPTSPRLYDIWFDIS